MGILMGWGVKNILLTNHGSVEEKKESQENPTV